MSKLSLEALKQRAEAVASEDLLATISGGTKNDCHPGDEGGGGPIDPNADKYKDLKAPDIDYNIPQNPSGPGLRIRF